MSNKKSSLQLISHANVELKGSYCIHLLYLLLTGPHVEESLPFCGLMANAAVAPDDRVHNVAQSQQHRALASLLGKSCFPVDLQSTSLEDLPRP